jgi:ribosome-associated protein
MAFTIPETELAIRATRAGGPGGQHVNKASTRIEILWDAARSPSLRPDERSRVLSRLANRLDAAGRVRVVAAAHRSQRQNLADARARLDALVERALHVAKPRKATRPHRGAVEARLQSKHRRGARKRDRTRPPDD